MDTGLQGDVVLVTGASGAIGSAIARHFAARASAVARPVPLVAQ
jgi:NAD(P)-dependent dehydrogenase (short-subunit alcohol dehydrogenase family)